MEETRVNAHLSASSARSADLPNQGGKRLMKMDIKLILGIVMICLLGTTLCFAARGLFLWFMSGQRDYGLGDPPAGEDEKGSYQFDPKTILKMPDPLEALQPSLDWPARVKIVDKVAWSEEDYYRIALAAVPPSWHGDLNLEFVDYELSCGDLAGTPQQMHYTFFNSAKNSEGRLVFSELGISVYPTEGQIWWRIQRFFRHPSRSLPLKTDLAHLKVMGADALHVAEVNGGSQYRQEAKGECRIEFTLGDGAWGVSYGGALGTLRITINAETGKANLVQRR
jgi:hypothetical protein